MKAMFLKVIITLFFSSCASDDNTINTNVTDAATPATTNKEQPQSDNSEDGVLKLIVSGTANNYTFNVTLKSPDTGCNKYADWWEVIDTNGNLIYRRILAHSHVNEQPFTRSGGLIKISATDSIIIRAHMNTLGYLPNVLTGTVSDGFINETFDTSKFSEVAKTGTLPESCAF